jgi:DNA-binding beta-propeller fold protein YncE
MGLFLFLFSLPAGDVQKGRAAAKSSPGKLFVDVSAADYIEVVDLGTRHAVDKIVVGKHPHGLALSHRTIAGHRYDFLYVTVEDTGELVIVEARSHKILARVHVGNDPNQLTLTRDGRFAYVPLRGEAKVAVVELEYELAKDRSQPGDGSEARVVARPKVVQKIAIG